MSNPTYRDLNHAAEILFTSEPYNAPVNLGPTTVLTELHRVSTNRFSVRVGVNGKAPYFPPGWDTAIGLPISSLITAELKASYSSDYTSMYDMTPTVAVKALADVEALYYPNGNQGSTVLDDEICNALLVFLTTGIAAKIHKAMAKGAHYDRMNTYRFLVAYGYPQWAAVGFVLTWYNSGAKAQITFMPAVGSPSLNQWMSNVSFWGFLQPEYSPLANLDAPLSMRAVIQGLSMPSGNITPAASEMAFAAFVGDTDTAECSPSALARCMVFAYGGLAINHMALSIISNADRDSISGIDTDIVALTGGSVLVAVTMIGYHRALVSNGFMPIYDSDRLIGKMVGAMITTPPDNMLPETVARSLIATSDAALPTETGIRTIERLASVARIIGRKNKNQKLVDSAKNALRMADKYRRFALIFEPGK